MGSMERGALWFREACAAWVDLARRNAWIVIAISIGVAAALYGYTVNHLRINTDTTGMLSEELPFRKNYLEYKRAFPNLSDTLVVVVDGANADLAEDAARRLADRLATRSDVIDGVFYAAGDPFFRRNGLLYLSGERLAALVESLAAAQPLIGTLAQDPSLRGLFEVLGLALDEIAKGIEGADRLQPALAAIADVLDDRAPGVSWSTLMGANRGGDAKRQIIVTRPRLDFTKLKPAAEAMRAVRATAVDLGLTPENGVTVRLTGGAALDAEELESVEHGASTASIASIVLVIVLLAIGLKSWRLAFAVTVTLVLGLLWTAGFAAVAVGELNLISVAFAVLFIGLAVDLGIYYSLRYGEAVERGLAHVAALRDAASGCGGALTLSALASTIAFFSFLPTPYHGVAELGLIAGVGMLIALFMNLTLLPALHQILPYPAPRVPHRPPEPDEIDNWVFRHRIPIAVIGVIVGLAGLPFLGQIKFSHDPLELKDPSRESVQTLRDLVADPQVARYTISILQPDLATADALARRLEALPTVERAVTASRLVPGDQNEKLALVEDLAIFLGPVLGDTTAAAPPDQAARRASLVQFRDRIGNTLASAHGGDLAPTLERLRAGLDRLLAGNAVLAPLETRLVGTLPQRIEGLRLALEAGQVRFDDLPSELRKRMLADDGRARIEVYPKEQIKGNEAALRRFVADVTAVAPNATDAPVIFLAAGEAVLGAFLDASLIALVCISLLLFLLLRNAWDVFLVLLPVVLAAIVTIAIVVLFDKPFNFANIIVLPLLIGIGVESGIQLVFRARHHGPEALLGTSTPRGVMFSALTTIGSFGTLAISPHQGTASLGELLTISITVKLVCALIVLPAMLSLTMRSNGRRPPPSPEVRP